MNAVLSLRGMEESFFYSLNLCGRIKRFGQMPSPVAEIFRRINVLNDDHLICTVVEHLACTLYKHLSRGAYAISIFSVTNVSISWFYQEGLLCVLYYLILFYL